jgi:dihydrofolate synthase / folylpolyglutamate synthase
MADHATSADPAVQFQLDRLTALSPGADILGLERITRLLGRIGDPHRHLPPVLHVAGTNGKGSTCAFLRAALEAAGLRTHVYSSPHLVRFNERIRLAGNLIDDATLAALLGEVLDAGGDIGASFFEVTTAAAFLAFARTPADACVVEVGLGGRLDATNVLTAPVVTGIAQLGIDHQAFLGDTLAQIAAEKAGIAKPGVPLVTMAYSPDIAAAVAAPAAAAGAPLHRQDRDWSFAVDAASLTYRDRSGGVTTPLPRLAGAHQPGNLALAIAMLRHQSALAVPEAALAAAATGARWPARMQRLGDGPLRRRLPGTAELWVDGGHNADAAHAVAQAAAAAAAGRPLRLVLGMLDNKDAAAMIAAFAPIATSLVAVPVPGHGHHPPTQLAAWGGAAGIASASAPDLPTALADMDADGVVLIAGSLYLAGTALALNDELPD